MHPQAKHVCKGVFGWQEGTVCLPGGRVAPRLLSIRHNTPNARGQAPLLAPGVTDITLTAKHASGTNPCRVSTSNIYRPPVCLSIPKSTPVYPPSNPNMHLSQGKCPRTVLLSFANITTDQGIIAQRLKFSYGVAEGATYVYITRPIACVAPLSRVNISWQLMVGAVWGWVGGKSDWWVITGPLLLPAWLLRSGGGPLPPSRHLLTREPPLTNGQLVASAKVPVMKIAGLFCFVLVLVMVVFNFNCPD